MRHSRTFAVRPLEIGGSASAPSQTQKRPSASRLTPGQVQLCVGNETRTSDYSSATAIVATEGPNRDPGALSPDLSDRCAPVMETSSSSLSHSLEGHCQADRKIATRSHIPGDSEHGRSRNDLMHRPATSSFAGLTSERVWIGRDWRR